MITHISTLKFSIKFDRDNIYVIKISYLLNFKKENPSIYSLKWTVFFLKVKIVICKASLYIYIAFGNKTTLYSRVLDINLHRKSHFNTNMTPYSIHFSILENVIKQDI